MPPGSARQHTLRIPGALKKLSEQTLRVPCRVLGLAQCLERILDLYARLGIEGVHIARDMEVELILLERDLLFRIPCSPTALV
jgi:hypothetical protein